ncbi:MAG: hypothetical protein OJF51_004163 [Nitrospira sp.]|nr:MAG: hypothetical protein OJF51_004163 [Nitrospira sp.]
MRGRPSTFHGRTRPINRRQQMNAPCWIILVAVNLPLSTLLSSAVLSKHTYFQQACIKN